MNLRPLFLFFVFVCTGALSAQKNDSMVLTFAYFLKTVKENHPISKQTALRLESADAGILRARGNFDPRLFYNLNQKQFNNTNYWTLQNGGVKVSTVLGLQLNAGVEQSYGSYLNNESITSNQGLAYSQFSLPLLQGLLIDERRYALKQAKLIKELSYTDQKNMLNDLYAKASVRYWEWAQAYYNLQVMKESVELAYLRLEGIKRGVLLGNNSLLDTLEASIQYQDRSVTLQSQEMDFYSKTMALSVFLWNEKNEPLEILADVLFPEQNILDQTDLAVSVVNQIDSLVETHPNLLAYQNKNEQLALGLRLKQDKLKPVLNIKFNPLYDLGNQNASGYYGVNNYKWGLGFEFPVLLRSERGAIKMAELEISNLDLEMQSKKLELTNALRASLNTYTSSKSQFEKYQEVVANYYKLLIAERKLFEIGESSVFLVNTRELNYINSKMKLNEMLFKYRKAGVDMLYSSGQLYNMQ